MSVSLLALLLVTCVTAQELPGPVITTEGGNLKFSTDGDLVFEAGPAATVKFQSTDGSPMTAPAGLKGAKGDTGASGEQGDTGTTGPQGPGGPRGFQGDMGHQGVAGLQGVEGSGGPPGSPGLPGIVTDGSGDVILTEDNWNQCVFQNLNSNQDYGLIAECRLQKRSNDTWLRLTWDGNMRIARCQVCCMNWYLAVDGHQCSGPAPIDTLIYQLTNNLIVRHSHFTGVCHEAGNRNIDAGLRRVQLFVKDCPGFDGYVYDAYTGWNTVSRIIVEEVTPRNPDVPDVPVKPPPTYQYKPNYCQVVYSNLQSNRERNLGVLTTINFNKLEDHTVLRITWEGNMRKHRCSSCCARWFVTVGGSECSAFEKIESSIYSNTAYSVFFPTTLTGLCYEAGGAPLVAGVHSIRLAVGNCPGSPIADLATGFYSTSRLIVEELPRSIGSIVNGVIYHPLWHHCVATDLDSNVDEGTINGTKCNFTKSEKETVVKVTWDGNLRVTNCNECCARWFITINGEECSDPAPIDGVVHSINGSQVSIHRSSSITGICKGTASGSLDDGPLVAVLNVQNCGAENISAFTGFQGVSVMVIEELPAPTVAMPPSYWPNYHQCVTTNLDSVVSGNETAIASCTITKQRNSTSLKVSWDGSIGLVGCSICCMRWYLTIDGEECSSPLPIDAAIAQDLTTSFNPLEFDMRRPATISGICHGPDTNSTFAAGSHSVELFVEQCSGGSFDEDYSVITGYKSVSRFILEEVEPENPCDIV